MKYRGKNSVVIEAVQFRRGRIADLLGFVDCEYIRFDTKENEYYIDTPEKILKIADGDFVIRGIKGEFYICKPDIFLATYDIVEEGQP